MVPGAVGFARHRSTRAGRARGRARRPAHVVGERQAARVRSPLRHPRPARPTCASIETTIRSTRDSDSAELQERYVACLDPGDDEVLLHLAARIERRSRRHQRALPLHRPPRPRDASPHPSRRRRSARSPSRIRRGEEFLYNFKGGSAAGPAGGRCAAVLGLRPGSVRQQDARAPAGHSHPEPRTRSLVPYVAVGPSARLTPATK